MALESFLEHHDLSFTFKFDALYYTGLQPSYLTMMQIERYQCKFFHIDRFYNNLDTRSNDVVDFGRNFP